MYDLLYAPPLFDTARSSEELRRLIEERRPGARDLLDVACGTGRHLVHLRDDYRVEGVDREPGMLREARRKLPGVPLHRGDVLDFALRRRFDVVTCLFSSIAYVITLARLRGAIANLARHLRPGGLLVVDGWMGPESWSAGRIVIHQGEAPGVNVVRMSRSGRHGRRVSTMDWHVLVGDGRGVQHFVEHHELGLFERGDYVEAFRRAGLDAEVLPGAADGRDRYIASRG